MRLSVVLATYNEAENISVCLQSVAGWCDEIIVVDGGSQDRTVELARKFGARVVITDNPPLFHINKQKAIDLASGKWILQLDADEQVTPALRREIDIVTSQKKIMGYWIPRKNYFLGRFLMKGGVYPDYTLRLYQNGKGKLPQKDVHEQAVVDGPVEYLKEPLIHLADKSFARYLLRYDRYTDLIAAELKQSTSKFSIYTCIQYSFIKPIYWFFMQYIRHKGFLDGWQGFIFSFFSSLRFPVSYIKFLLQ
jgi:glycosyltransferase involved in cell wall biosynthesis